MPDLQSPTGSVRVEMPSTERPRRLSVVSLPTTNPTATLAHRKEEEGSPTVPYLDGPTQIMPGIWLGSEDNARDWKGLIERGIKSILNVAKEVSLPFDAAQPMRPFASTPNLKQAVEESSTYYPAHLPTGRPSMHYLKLQWSHGQQDLVEDGFPAAMAFTDAALARGEGVLVQYVFLFSLVIVLMSCIVASVVFLARQQWSSLLLCERLHSRRRWYLPRFMP